MQILSVFDGMSCAMLALMEAGVTVDRYVAYEIDKYAIQTSSHNFPMIEHRGDVFAADFTEFEGFDFLMGGSPCTYWSIAQKNNRETEASGMGWELFSQYVRALREAKPKYFIYENNKSMSKAIRASISDTFGFEPICINSALVSAQNRQRLYWCGIRQADGTYKKADIPQPEDRGILLKDILESGVDLTTNDKGYTLTASYNGAVAWNTIERSQGNMVCEPVRIPAYGSEDKSRPVTYSYAQQGPGQIEKNCYPENPNKQKYDYVAEPVNITPDGKSQTIKAQYQQTSPRNICCYTSTYGASGVAERVGTFPNEAKNQDKHDSQQYRIYGVNAKSVTLCGGGGGMGAKTGLYAIPVEFEDGRPTKAVSCTDGKTYDVYTVKGGQITIKGKQYPIKLVDGYYIIRKLTVRECMRLQTVPEWFCFPCSNAQAYKMLGNGFTIQVISHLIRHTLTGAVEDSFEQLTL